MKSEVVTGSPKVSVVIPACSSDRYVAAAIRSVLALEYEGEVEIVVVDDGSKDKTADVVREFGGQLKLICKENAGLPAARNTGIREASGDFLVFLDADDELEPHAIETFMAAFRRLDPGFGMVACCSYETGPDGELVSDGPSFEGDGIEISYEDLVLRNRFTPAVMARRAVLEEVGLFDESLRACEDRDMWIRMAMVSRILHLPDRLVRMRKHGENMTYNADRQARCIALVIEKSRHDPRCPVSSGDALWRRSLSVMDYQDSFMQLRAGKRGKALGRLLRSWWRWPFFVRPQQSLGLPRFFRLLRLWRILKVDRG